MYSVVELGKTGIVEVERVKTIEEANDLWLQWMKYRPENKYEVLEVQE